MTARPGGAFGRGYTASGESVVRTVAEGRAQAQKERVRNMARKNADTFSATPGASGPGTHKVEEPLRVGPRDALIDDGQEHPEDYIPDVDSKGYHVGMVRQPAAVVANEAGQPVGFASEHPSKFAEQPTIADLKAHHNAEESKAEWNEGVDTARQVTMTPEETKAAKAALSKAQPSGRSRSAKPASDTPTAGDELREAAQEG